MKRITTINATKAQRLTTEAIQAILVEQCEVLDEDLALSDGVIQRAFETIEKEAKAGSRFCYVPLTEEEFLHTCSSYIEALIAEFGYKVEVKGGFVAIFW